MSLNEDDRKTVVKLQMNKARLFLEQADQMCKQQYWDIASNRFPYTSHFFRGNQTMQIR
ncbi:MAG: hypothetical protein J6R28_06880 [Bacteroides sp.]|jgi:hypothetical protein|nr:hypothetical protein [Bacteroides sp.]